MKHLIAIATLLALALPAFGQDASARAAQALASADSRLNALETRVDTLEQRAGLTAASAASAKRSYASAYALALSRNLPLLAWNGTAVCPECITSTDGTEFVSFVGDVPGCPANAITVSIPEGGELRGVGVVDSWIGGDPTFGHLPSVRRLLQRWRNRGYAAQPAAAPAFAAYQPAMLMAGNCAACNSTGYGYGQPMMTSFGGGGGCTACGQSRGFFRR